MTGIGHRKPSPAAARLPASKLHGKDFPKVKKLQKFSVPAVPLPPPGCALVPADLLQQLQSEVSKTALPVQREKAEVPAGRREPEVPLSAKLHDPPSHPHPSHPVAKASPKPLRSQKNGGARPIVLVKHAGVSTEDTVDGPPPPPGAKHASVGTVDAVEEGTQTTPEKPVQPVMVAAAPAATLQPAGSPSGVHERALPGEKNQAEPWQTPQPVVTPIGIAAFSGAVQPGSPDKMNSTDHGRFDLFGMDKFTAEKDRDRKRLQAQMLADQIQEQRERKEEELRRKREEEMREERRLARELREIEERHRHEQAGLAGWTDAPNEPPAKAPPARVPGQGPVRRRKSSKDLACESPAGANSYTHLRADSSAGPWVDGDERRRRRPRRRRREVESNGMGQDSSWQASERDKRTWRDANLSHSMLPDGRDTHSQSPVPWMTASPQDNGDHPDGLQTVLEEEMKRTEARRRRRRAERTSERRDMRERGDSYDTNDTWESAQNRSHEQEMRARADVTASWMREEEEEQSRRRGGRVPVRRGEQLAAVAEVPVESPRQQKANQPTAVSDTDLREQIGSLVKVCEQLLRERAEERGNRNPKGTPAGGASPNRKTQERTERQSPSPRRLPAVSKQQFVEDAPRTGMSGAALGSARGASQASKPSRNPTTTDWRSSQAPAPDVGSPAAGGASDMHTYGENPIEAAAQKTAASGSSSAQQQDSLSELLQVQSRMIAGSEIPEAYAVSYQNAMYSATPAAVAPVGHHEYRAARPSMGALAEESPFASPARGIAVRRSSRSYRRDSGGWGGRLLASPPLVSRGGLNVQANWEPLGLGEGGNPFHRGSRRSRGPGQVPIGINPSIQAQSAMLREMYPNVAMGGPGPGPLARG